MKTIHKLMPILMAATLANAACVAKYRTIHKPQAGEGAEDPKNSAEGNPANPDAAQENPSAGLEIILDGKSVTKVEAGESFILQPTKDTLDPDNRNDDCTNPGIVSALYKVSNGNILSAERAITPACDKGLEVTHAIATPGTYVITLQVKTDEGEAAEATGTLIVTAKGASSTVDGGLVVKGDPLIVKIGVTVDFSAVCADGQDVTITWDFGDAATASGKKTTHAYASVGSKIAKAKCTKPGLDDMWGSVTIVVLPNDITDTATGDDDGSDGSSTNVPPQVATTATTAVLTATPTAATTATPTPATTATPTPATATTTRRLQASRTPRAKIQGSRHTSQIDQRIPDARSALGMTGPEPASSPARFARRGSV